MSAIWPAGPPKPRQPIFSQTRTASAKLTVRGIQSGFFFPLAPCVQRVVHDHAVLEHLDGRPGRGATSPAKWRAAPAPAARGPAGRCRRRARWPRACRAQDPSRWNLSRNASKLQRSPSCVNSTPATSYGRGRFLERLFSRRPRPAHRGTPLRGRRNGAPARAGDAVDLRPLAGDPARGCACGFGGGLAAFLTPMLDAALEVARAERLGRVLADFVAVHAVDDHACGARKRLRPFGDLRGVAP